MRLPARRRRKGPPHADDGEGTVWSDGANANVVVSRTCRLDVVVPGASFVAVWACFRIT